MEAPAPPWHYNASAWSQRIPICVMAAVGTVISVYLALFQYGLIDKVWDPFFGDQPFNEETAGVLKSDVSHAMTRWFGIHDAALGALAYLGDAVFGLAGSTRRWQYRPWMVIIFGIDVIPLGVVSAVLVFLQGAVVGHWCFLCLVTAVISLVLVYFAYDEVYASLHYLWRVWRKSRSWRVVWATAWGWPTPIGDEVAEQLIRATGAR